MTATNVIIATVAAKIYLTVNIVNTLLIWQDNNEADSLAVVMNPIADNTTHLKI